ncbi:conserved hypothetical protein [Theileria equi strain WA]|uniref:Cwf15/Cwc15 cell cycle control protein n=1 Tax=Theileria equi strain WA TaxID=1537102 RepID=L1LE18_THEEQ|nr:conserved hypothetical protein [Theileria equi strain WA]EKX73398.1 conserved hypothetical protein [Theileria equi strain WA]|eukprot:XP_004832850.1 conserved hypothetical protein [Theileria equi strain WA]
MSTAHRPTWYTAIGRAPDAHSGTAAVSSKDLPSHKELKRRAPISIETSEGTKVQKANEQKRILREKLESTEAAHKTKALIEEKVGVTKNFLSLEDATKLLNQDINAFPEDEDDYVDEAAVDDEDDEEAILLRELEKIKKEKEEIRLKEQQEQLQSQEHREKILSQNPLLNITSQASRWDEDVVFKNPRREVKEKPEFVLLIYIHDLYRFINDVVRSEFHKRFLHKYVL